MTKSFLEAVKEKYVYTNDDIAAEEDLVVSAEGQQEEKKWVMVGMAKHKKKTGQLDRLRSLAVGEEGFATVDSVEEISAALPNLARLELAKATFSTWTIPTALLAALPKVNELDLSCVSLFPSSTPIYPTPNTLQNIRRLILNKTGVSWSQVVTSLNTGVPSLEDLRVEGNELSSLDDGGVHLEAPSLRQISLRDNKISSWKGIKRILDGKKEKKNMVSEFILSANELGDPEEDVVEALHEAGVTSICLAENKTGKLGFLKQLKTVTSLKVTYPTIEGVAPNHVRLLVIADMPGLLSLNSSTVSSKERGEAEKFYTIRAFNTLPKDTTHADDCSDLKETFLEEYPFYKEYVAKWSNPSKQAQAEGGSGGVSGLSTLTLRDCCEGRKFKPDVTRPFPGIMKVAQLKAVVKAAFQVEVADQRLTYKSLDCEIPVPMELDNDLEALTYYGIYGGKGVVEVSLK